MQKMTYAMAVLPGFCQITVYTLGSNILRLLNVQLHQRANLYST